MRRTTIGIIVIGTLALAGCGGKRFVNNPRPPVPVNLSVYINDARVTVSPTSVGAGPVLFIITNQASEAESLTITRHGSAVASTGPINPQATAQISVDPTPGDYTVASSPVGGTEASHAERRPTHSALLRIGVKRPSGSDQLEQP